MKLLITNDLHGHLDWYEWLIENSCHNDVVIIAGDILNGFDHNIGVQISNVYDKLIDLSKVNKNVFVCSGNHDMNNTDALSWWKKLESRTDVKDKILQLPHWMDVFSPHFHVDNENVILNDVLFTTFMNNEFLEDDTRIDNHKTLAEALKLKDKCKKWIIVYHQPPFNSVLCESFPPGGCGWIRDLIKLHEPTYVFSGHVHGAPFVNGGKFFEVIGKTICFNGGSSSDPKFHVKQRTPCHITLDTETNKAVWFNNKNYIEVDIGVI